MARAIDDKSAAPARADHFSLETAYGSVKPSARPEDFEELARIARDEKVEVYVARFGRSRRRRRRDGG